MTGPAHGRARALLLIVGLVLVALNLRPALSSVAPVLGDVRRSLGLSATAAGLLTTLPVLCLGLFAPVAGWLARRWDAERAVFLTLFVLGAGSALRGYFGAAGLFAGALLAGASIGVIGVLLPPLVKRSFVRHTGTMTGVYSTALCLGAAIAAGVTVPLRDAFGGDWRPALALWAVPALVAALAWWPQLRSHTRQADPVVAGTLWHEPLAWAVTLYMGLQSALAYCVFGWLAPVIVDRGLGALQAGFLMSISVLAQLVTAFSGPWLATHLGRDQRPAILLVLGLSLVGALGVVYAPLPTLPLWAVLLGLGQGGQFSIALLLIVVRSPNPAVASRLSAMAQGVGYTIASMGPLAVGLLRDATGSSTVFGTVFAVIAVSAAVAGWSAGGQRTLPLPRGG